MIINVTKVDINKGIRGSTSYCPIVIASARKFKGYSLLEVFHDRIRLVKCFNTGKTTNSSKLSIEELLSRYKLVGKIVYLPKKAQQFIVDYDAGNKVKPFKFKVEA